MEKLKAEFIPVPKVDKQMYFRQLDVGDKFILLSDSLFTPEHVHCT